MARLIVAPIIGLIVIGKNFNIILMLSILPIFPIAIYFLYKLYKKQGELLEIERKVYIDLSKNIEQNTSGFSLIKLYNEQQNQREKFNKVNEEVKQLYEKKQIRCQCWSSYLQNGYGFKYYVCSMLFNRLCSWTIFN